MRKPVSNLGGFFEEPSKLPKEEKIYCVLVSGSSGDLTTEIHEYAFNLEKNGDIVIHYDVGGGIRSSKTIKKNKIKKVDLICLSHHPYTIGVSSFCFEKNLSEIKSECIKKATKTLEDYLETGKKVSMDSGIASLFRSFE